ncbi:MAG: hypothetical protein JO241_04605 [Candidatus Eremiobacteraeota bacterium]|nr:hypothetical protein [Candidatus Eremiobacteraeota bacterium]
MYDRCFAIAVTASPGYCSVPITATAICPGGGGVGVGGTVLEELLEHAASTTSAMLGNQQRLRTIDLP